MRERHFSGWDISQWLISGEWSAHPIRTLVAIAAIALGVALGFAIHLINAAAFNEFSAAVKSLSGQSDLQVRATQPHFDEALYPKLAQHPDIAVASPVLELNAVVDGKTDALKVLGIDVFQAASVAPDLIGLPAEDEPFDILADDAIFLSPAAQEWLGLEQGDTLHLRSGTGIVALRVAGGLAQARVGQRLAVMDIGTAQWRFNRVGQLSRIDVKLVQGIDRAAFKTTLAQQLGTQYLVTETEDQETRTANMSRAYRVNLNVLALVALFTGAFLVFSTQALSVIRRRSQLALLRVLGLTRTQLLVQILLEGVVLGIIGALIGLLLGYGMAATALRFFGGDLGGGYFPGIRPTVQFAPVAAIAFFLMGTIVALLGCAAPAWEAARSKPARALKSGSEDAVLSKLSSPLPPLVALAIAALFTQLPPVFNLPVFGYLAVVLLLIGGIALMPRVAAVLFGALSHAYERRATNAVATVALARLANAPNQASIALGGVLSSFSLMVAMAIMVASFRISVDDWLSQVLAADLYVRAAETGETALLNPEEQDAIANAPGIEHTEMLRFMQLTLDPQRPNVSLIARPIDATDPSKRVPVTGGIIAPHEFPPGVLPIWVSEPMVDLYGYHLGRQVSLTIAGKPMQFIVAGVWRDYARQFGAIQMRLSEYRLLTGDYMVNDVGVWLQPGISIEQVISALQRLPFGAALQFEQPEEIRALSLRIFDRSFAVTYLLEVVAIIIGLFGIAATFSAQTLARAKEFGMMRHIGVTRRQILGMLALEGGMLASLGVIMGFLLGTAISLILVFIVNPQSFHWTMQLHVPWNGLAAVATLLLLSAAATALLAGRHAVSGDAVRAVREDC